MVNLDEHGLVSDFYFPYVGQENHTHGSIHKIGIWVDGNFSWLDQGGWDISTKYRHETMSSDIVAVNHDLQITLSFHDVVYNESNIFIREVGVKNMADHTRSVKVYFNQQFRISHSGFGNTGYYDPCTKLFGSL